MASPVIRVRCHPSRRAWYEMLLAGQGCELEIETDESMCPGTAMVTPPAYAQDIKVTIGFENPDP